MNDEPVIRLRRFDPTDQEDAKALILAGLADHWGELDPTLNPDLNNIAESYELDFVQSKSRKKGILRK